MAETSPRRTSPWIAFLAGVVAVLAILLVWFAVFGGERAARGVRLGLRQAPSLPTAPRLPDAPRIPGAPVPMPK